MFLVTPTGSSGRCDDDDHHDRNSQHAEEAGSIAAHHPEILQHYFEYLHDGVVPLGLPNLRLMRAIRSSGVIRPSTRLN